MQAREVLELLNIDRERLKYYKKWKCSHLNSVLHPETEQSIPSGISAI